jgi:quercetin dioxygenase-like cupin family protein
MGQVASKELIRVGELAVRFLVEAGESNGSVAVFECFVPANARMPAPHSHDGFEETIYGLEGTSTWTIDGETVEIGPGDSMCVARGTIHAFSNPGADDVKFLAIASPGLFGPSYFREVGDVVASSAGGPPDLAAIGAVMRRHGLTPAPPPGS